MSDATFDPHARIRQAVYGLLVVIAVGVLVGRVWTVKSSLGKTPLLSANDRSRWCTIRSLGDHGTYVIDDVMFTDAKHTKRDREWFSIDVVRHKGHDGQEHFYSSKPPLLSTLLAGPYWLIRKLTGATLAERPFYVVRMMLLLTTVAPLAVYFWILLRFVERHGQTDWGRLFVAAATVFGTYLSTFAVTLNNHIIAAVSATFALFAAWRIWGEGEPRLRYYAAAGFFGAFAVANELPSLSLCACLAAALAYRSLWRTCAAFLPAAGVVAAAFFWTTYLAHGTWAPPYAHRGEGPLLVQLDGDFVAALEQGTVPMPLAQSLSSRGIELSHQTTVKRRPSDKGWVLWDPLGQDRLALAADGRSLSAFEWDQWYEFDNSYWFSERRSAVDRGEASPLAYAFHVLVGHHGVFSLTPMWLLSVIGAGIWLSRHESQLRGLAVLVLVISAVCFAFYLSRPLHDRNYGGVTCAFRWAFWLIPLWLLVMVPAADLVARRRWSRNVALGLLALSVVSASYASLNPWSHPWLYEYWVYLGWIVP